MTRRKTAPMLLQLCAIAMIVSIAGFAMAAGQVGEPAHNFSLQEALGGSHMLSDYLGNVVFLAFMGYG